MKCWIFHLLRVEGKRESHEKLTFSAPAFESNTAGDCVLELTISYNKIKQGSTFLTSSAGNGPPWSGDRRSPAEKAK